MADEIVILKDGLVQQVATPEKIYNYPNNISMTLYQWQGDAYQMINETDRTRKASYNVTHSYTRYAPSGFSVYNSTSDYTDGIQQVHTKSGTTENLIITNIENNEQNVTISGITNDLTMDAQTGELYDTSSGTLSLGVMDAYEIKYLTTPTLKLWEDYGLYKYNYLDEYIDDGNEIWISARGTRQIHIASTLPAVEIEIRADIADCDKISTIVYAPKDGTNVTWTGSGAIAVCNAINAGTQNITVNTSSESNLLLWSYVGDTGIGMGGADNVLCDDGITNLKSLLFFIPAFIAMAIFMIFLAIKNGGMDMNIMKFLGAFVSVIVFIGFLIVLLWKLGGC
jgi:hypothetical protein